MLLEGLNLKKGAWGTTHKLLSLLKKSKMVFEEALNSWERQKTEKQRRKGKIYPPECRVPKNKKER